MEVEKMRKILALFMVITMTVATLGANSVAASDINSTELISSDDNKEFSFPEKIVVEQNKAGYFVESNSKSALTGNMSKDLGIYELNDGTKLSYTGTDCFQVVETIDIVLTDLDAINQVAKDYNLEKNVLEDIMRRAEMAIASKNNIASMTIATTPVATKGSYSVDYTYNGHDMRDTFVYYYNINTGYRDIKEGTAAKSYANGAYNFALVCAGFASTPVALVAGGLSILGWWASHIGSTSFTGSTGDYVQVKVYYDVQDKYTYVDMGSGFQTGLVSQTVKILTNKTIQYWVNSSHGYEEETVVSPNKRVYSPNYDNAAAVAFVHAYNPLNEQMRSTIGDYTLYY